MLLGQAKLRLRCGKVNLDLSGLIWLALRAQLENRISHAADLSPSQSQAPQPARVPHPDGRSLGSRGAFAPSQEGSQAADGESSLEARRALTADERLPRVRRLARTAELERVQREGRRKRLAHLDVLWADNQAGHPRMGLIVPKFQSSVVARNRLRRRLKELWRRELMGAMPAWDIVIRARKEAYAAGFGPLRDELRAWRTAVA